MPERVAQLEAWSEQLADLSPEQARVAESSGLVSARVHEPPNRWRLVSGSRVGTVGETGAASWGVRVVPKLAIPKLMFLLAYAADEDGWREAIASYGEDDDFFSAIASGFAHHATTALEPGPLRGYVAIDERIPALRGRVRFADQAARLAGLPLPLEVTYDEFTPDVHENRLLLAAAEVLLRFPMVPERARGRLRRIRAALDGVSAPASSEPPLLTRLNRRYRSSLQLASLILRHASISAERGETDSVAFVFDLNKVFENFLAVALTAALRRHGGVVRLQDVGRHLDAERKLPLRPDVTWWRQGRCQAVVDAKYKRLTSDRFPNADAYQMLAYCVGYGLPEGTLVYARDEKETARDHSLRDGRTTIRVRSIDVEVEPEALLGQVQALAAELAASANR